MSKGIILYSLSFKWLHLSLEYKSWYTFGKKILQFKFFVEKVFIIFIWVSFRAVERTEDFTRGPGKILKYDSKRGKFCSHGPPFEIWAPVKITTSPPVSTALVFFPGVIHLCSEIYF
jgi:hypothetical protein